MKQMLPRSSQKRSSLPWTSIAVVIVAAMTPVSRLSPAAIAAQRGGDAAPAKTALPAGTGCDLPGQIHHHE